MSSVEVAEVAGRSASLPGPTSRVTTADRGLRLAMAVYGDITYDSRVQREAVALADAGHSVTVFCLAWSSARTPRFDGRVDVIVLVPDRSGIVPGTASPFLDHRPTTRLQRLRARVGWLTGYVRNLRAWGRMAIERAGPVDVWHLHDFAALFAIAPRVVVPVCMTSTTSSPRPARDDACRARCGGPPEPTRSGWSGAPRSSSR